MAGKNGPKIFVLMPFKSELDNVYFAVERAGDQIGAQVEKADRPVVTDPIIQRIHSGIENADLVLADLTDSSPNVFYEVGYAHASGKPVALLAPDLEIPFDLRGYPILTYSANSSVAELIELFRPYLKAVLVNASDTSSLRAPLEHALRRIASGRPTSRLFKVLVGNKVSTFADDVTEWMKGTMRVGPEEVREKGAVILESLEKGGFATFLVPVESYWIGGADYLEAARRVCRDRGRRITRVYILYDRSGAESDDLLECIRRDEESGIETLICFEDKISDQEAIRDFGIWDDEVLCLVDVTDISKVVGCTFTTDSGQLARALRWKQNILSVAEPASLVLAPYRKEVEVRAPLVTSAPMMAEIADRNCRGSYLDNENCRWYHRAWQFLRMVDAVSTPDWHEEFYRRSIRSAVSNLSLKRILVCGTADYCMLNHLTAALREANIKDSEIVVLDLCRTPLEICEWFGRRFDIEVRTFQGNALALDFRDNWFGLILTDAFLTRFTADKRARVVREWRRVLETEGSVITTVRIDESLAGKKVQAAERDVAAFALRVKTAAYKITKRLPCPVHEIEGMAREYAEKIVSFPLAESGLADLFKDFETNIEIEHTPGEFAPTSYARILARKI